MTHTDVDGLPEDTNVRRPAGPDHPGRILHDMTARAAALAFRKPSNWWVFEREPWKRINAEIVATEKAAAERARADRAVKSAFAFAAAALALAHASSLPPGDRE
jgi:hypothetical protein